MRLLTVITSAFLLTGCHRAIAPQTSVTTLTSDSTSRSVELYDTIIAIPGSKVLYGGPLPKPGELVQVHQQSGNAELTIKAHDGQLDVECDADSLQQVITLLRKQISEIKTVRSDSTIVVTKFVPVVKTKYPTSLWISLALNILAIVAFYFGFKSSAVSSIFSIFSFIKKIKI